MRIVVLLLALFAAPSRAGVLLEELTWLEAEKVLRPETVVVIALGAQAKEHGPHLKLDNDFVMAEYLKRRVLAASDVVVAPTLNYGFYSPFVAYPGSTSLRLETARDVVVDVVRSLARFGPKRFYVLNTGVKTVESLAPAAQRLAADGILLRYTNALEITADVEKAIVEQEGGTHADEVETSMMLYIAPDRVDMTKAKKDYTPRMSPGPFTRDPDVKVGVYSPSGVWGDPTLATRDKGERIVEAMVERIVAEIESLRRARLPRD